MSDYYIRFKTKAELTLEDVKDYIFSSFEGVEYVTFDFGEQYQDIRINDIDKISEIAHPEGGSEVYLDVTTRFKECRYGD